MKNYYELLAVDPTASPAEIKRAFREQIARYHPDKVQHLGEEFQQIAADRATDLTAAYRTLMDEHLRADYDRQLGVEPAAADPDEGRSRETTSATPFTARSQSSEASSPPRPTRGADQARQTGDAFVRQVTLGRIRDVMKAEPTGRFEEKTVPGFDLAGSVVKTRLFGRASSGPVLLVKLVPEVNQTSIQETWTRASRALARLGAEGCVMLVGRADSVHAAGRLASDLRKRPAKGASRLSLVPVDHRDWSAAADEAPDICRSVLERLKAS